MGTEAADSLLDMFDRIQILLAPLSWTCPALTDEFLYTLVNRTNVGVDKVQGLLAAETIYPLYDGIVQDFFCNSVIRTWAWLAIFSGILGFFLVPCLAWTGHAYLTWWSANKRGKEDDYENFEEDDYEVLEGET